MQLIHRLRRNRMHKFSRNLICEHNLNPQDLVYPLFVCSGNNIKQPIQSMPGQNRLSPDLVLQEAENILNLNIPAIALFPVTPIELKTLDAKEAYNPENLLAQTINLLKNKFPELGIIADVALDPFTSHGQDGILNQDNNQVDNDQTVELLNKQALVYAQAGADILAPSAMMDGCIHKIRASLEQNNFINTQILAYSAKFASNFYDPFRNAVGSEQNLDPELKYTYQIFPTNTQEALREISQDINEGADMIMIKPANLYSDIIYQARNKFNLPVFAYQVSGEYSMLKTAILNNWIRPEAIIESLLCLKRAGASAIISYFAKEAARLM